jgi:hypothetical protein
MLAHGRRSNGHYTQVGKVRMKAGVRFNMRPFRQRLPRAAVPLLLPRRRRAAPLMSNEGDSCGCALGAKVLAGAFVVSSVWYAWQAHTSNLGAGAVGLRVFLWSFLGAVVGKLVGIGVYALRRQRLQVRRFPS